MGTHWLFEQREGVGRQSQKPSHRPDPRLLRPMAMAEGRQREGHTFWGIP